MLKDFMLLRNMVKGGGGDEASMLDSLIERSISGEFVSDVSAIGDSSFRACYNLTAVNFPKATNIYSQAFRECTELISVNIPLITELSSYAFYKCTKLTTLNAPNLTMIGEYCFQECHGLTTVNYPNVTTVGGRAFVSCYGITSVRLPLIETIPTYCFNMCNKITVADFTKVKQIESYALASCTSMKALILRSETIVTLKASNGITKLNDNYIYVPRALVDGYKSATNWSTYAAQFRALEDYTVDGTITGELDKIKI